MSITNGHYFFLGIKFIYVPQNEVLSYEKILEERYTLAPKIKKVRSMHAIIPNFPDKRILSKMTSDSAFFEETVVN